MNYNNKIEYSNFQKLVLHGEFENAYIEMKKMNIKDIENELISISFDDYNTLAYAFLVFALDKEQDAMLNVVVANLFLHSYNVWEGSYKIAQMYAEKAISVDDNCIDAWKVIMFLGRCPDSTLGEEDAFKARERIEKIDPNDPCLKD